MWAEVKKAPNLVIAEMWKAFFEGEGIPSLILPETLGGGEDAPHRVFVPKDREHILSEVFKRL